MSRTGWSLVVAGMLVIVSVGLAAGRRYVLGPDLDATDSEHSWTVTLVATGELKPQETAVTLSLAPDFRSQHITDEHFASKELSLPRISREKVIQRREATFRRVGTSKAQQPFRLDYVFHVHTGIRQPTPGMSAVTAELDSPPFGPATLQQSSYIESDDKAISQKAMELIEQDRLDDKENKEPVVALFDYVSKLPTEASFDGITTSARGCFIAGRGDSGGKARLLVALCRNRGIPARLMSGLVLSAGPEQSLHQWAEAWVNQQWLPMCPTRHHFGREHMSGFLVLHIGDDDLVRCRGKHQLAILVHSPHHKATREPSMLRDLWQKLSLTNLRRGERNVVRFLLLLPLAALIVSFIRTVVGVPTFGTFSPALLGLAFLNLNTLHWGLGIFVLVVLAGWCMRHLLEGFHLLQVPRTSALLTLIVALLIMVVVIAAHTGIAATQYISLFPLVILTHLVERFWTVEAEDGTTSSFKTLLGTMAVAATVSVSLAPDAVAHWMFRYPETLGVVLAAQFVLGRYTGYRLTELYRFGDLLAVEEFEKGSEIEKEATKNQSMVNTDDKKPANFSSLTPTKQERLR